MTLGLMLRSVVAEDWAGQSPGEKVLLFILLWLLNTGATPTQCRQDSSQIIKELCQCNLPLSSCPACFFRVAYSHAKFLKALQRWGDACKAIIISTRVNEQAEAVRVAREKRSGAGTVQPHWTGQQSKRLNRFGMCCHSPKTSPGARHLLHAQQWIPSLPLLRLSPSLLPPDPGHPPWPGSGWH